MDVKLPFKQMNAVTTDAMYNPMHQNMPTQARQGDWSSEYVQHPGKVKH
jgi:hypothetical protein